MQFNAVSQYIRGENIPESLTNNDQLANNAGLLTYRLATLLRDKGISISFSNLFDQIMDETIKSLSLTFLTRFELQNFEPFPDSFFK